MIKRVLTIFILVVFVFTALLPLSSLLVKASSVQQLQDKINQSNKNKQQIKDNINDKNKQKQDLLAQIEDYDDDINALNSQIQDMNGKIAVDDAQIAQVQGELDIASEKAAKQYETFKERLRVMYECGSSNYIDILLESKSLSDFLNKYEIVKQIAEYDNNMFDKLEKSRKEIEDKKDDLEKIKAIKVEKVNSLNAAKSNLDAIVSEKGRLVSEVNKSIAQLEAQYEKEAQAEAALRAQIIQLQNPGMAYTGGTMLWPCPSTRYITSPYGSRYHPVLKYNRFHAGIDIGAGMGANVIAANAGVVIKAEYSSSYGNYVVIDHGGGITTLYAHGSAILVSRGQTVSAGQSILKVGSTGISTGPHLHFEVLVNGSAKNPLDYVN